MELNYLLVLLALGFSQDSVNHGMPFEYSGRILFHRLGLIVRYCKHSSFLLVNYTTGFGSNGVLILFCLCYVIRTTIPGLIELCLASALLSVYNFILDFCSVSLLSICHINH
jgi:hypothetical protein